MFSFKSLWSKADTSKELQISREPVVFPKNWRIGMWVTTLDGQTGILTKFGALCVIHLVDAKTGETVEEITREVQQLRQAKISEIPSCRKGISYDKLKALGYGT